MLPAIYLLVALINLSANLNNYNIKNHPLDIRVRRDVQTSIGNDMGIIFKELRERRKPKSAENERGERRDKENRHFEDPEEDITKVLVIDPKEEEGINVSGNDSTERKYNSDLLRLLYPDDRKVTSTSEAWKRDRRSVDSRKYYNPGINNTANVQMRRLATRNNTRVPDSNVMSLYARRAYQYSNIYNRTNNTNHARAPSPHNANIGLYQAKPVPYSNEYQREYYNHFTNNNRQFNNYKLPTNNQFTNNLTDNRLFNNNGYDPNRNIHFNYNQIHNNNMSNNNLYHNSNGYSPNRNINFNNKNLSNNNGYGPNRNINYNYNEMNNKSLSNNNLYHNNNGYDSNRNINLNNSRYNDNNIYHNNNAYNPNRDINFSYNQIDNNNMSNNNKNNGYDANRNIHFNYNQINNNNNNFSNNNLYHNNNGYDPNRNMESNNNILSNNKLFIDNTAQNPFLNQVAPSPTSEYRGEPSTTTSTTPFIVESCILCGSAGCPSLFKRIGFLCVPQKH